MPLLLLIDGHSQAYRAFFAIKNPMSTRDGEPTGAVYGFARKLLSVLRDEDVIVDARGEASALVADDPTLERHPVLRAALDAALDPDRADYLEKA